MMEGDARDLFAEGTERMDIAFADAPEIVEIDAQLIGRVRGAHEGGLRLQVVDIDIPRIVAADDDDPHPRKLGRRRVGAMRRRRDQRSEEHTSELQSLTRISYAVLCLQNKTNKQPTEPE